MPAENVELGWVDFGADTPAWSPTPDFLLLVTLTLPGPHLVEQQPLGTRPAMSGTTMYFNPSAESEAQSLRIWIGQSLEQRKENGRLCSGKESGVLE